MSPSSAMVIRGAVSLLELAVAGLLASDGSSGSIPVRIELDAPPGCSDSAAFYAGLRERTERVRAAIDGERGIELHVRLTKTREKVGGELRLVDESGATDTRVVEGSSCEEVVAALSLTAALALDPSARSDGRAPVATAAPRAAALPRAAPPEESRRAPFQLELAARALASEVVSPFTSLGGAVSVRWTRPAGSSSGTSFGLDVMYLDNELVTDVEDVAVSFTALALSACPLGWRLGGGFELRPCAVVAGGRLGAEGRGVASPEAAARSWWSTGALARATAALGAATAVELEVGANFPLFYRRFVIGEPPRQVAETPVISALIALGASHRF